MNMLCENCKKNIANTYFKQTVNGKTEEIFLCSECAAKLGVAQTIGQNSDFGFGDLLNQFFAPYSQGKTLSSAKSTASDIPVCPFCSTSEREFFKTGKAGCEKCYATFSRRLAPYLGKLHGNKKHAGKRPISAGATKKSETVEDLKKELTEAVKNEDFEKAVVLRDRIKELESGSAE